MSTETPDTETPDAETTGAETVDTETPDAETADAETADAETADTETPDTEQQDLAPHGEDAAQHDESEEEQHPRDTDGATGADTEARPTKPSRREALEAEGDVAADFLEALLDIADIVGDIDVDIDGDRAAVSIVDSDEGRVPRRLVGPDGKVLEALQELTRLAVQTETGERSRLMLDIAGHRAGRRAEIVEIAQGVISQVRETGAQVEMEPMSAFERKIVHDEVLAAGLRSESEGVEPHRYVIVLPSA